MIVSNRQSNAIMSANIPTKTLSNSLKCSHCALGDLCLPVGLDQEDMAELENIIRSSSPFRDGESIYTVGEPFGKLYAVKSGMFKTVVVDALGNEHITSFHLPGDLVGLDAIHSKYYVSTAVALGTANVCEIAYRDVESLARKIPSLQQQMFNMMSKEVQASQSLSVDLTAEQKLAAFIVSLSSRYKQRGYSETRFNLVMPRRDIANHLNLAPETISRLFKRFQSEDLLAVERTDVRLLNLPKLKEMSGCKEYC